MVQTVAVAALIIMLDWNKSNSKNSFPNPIQKQTKHGKNSKLSSSTSASTMIHCYSDADPN